MRTKNKKRVREKRRLGPRMRTERRRVHHDSVDWVGGDPTAVLCPISLKPISGQASAYITGYTPNCYVHSYTISRKPGLENDIVESTLDALDAHMFYEADAISFLK